MKTASHPSTLESETENLGETELATLTRSQKLWEGNRPEREEFFRTVLESLGEGLLITDEQSRIIYANTQLSELTGYSKDELIGRTSFELLLPREEWPTQRRRLGERLSDRK
ncbi:MAG: PAS domain-containing protein, partial [Verrucomicrobiota bacterium]